MTPRSSYLSYLQHILLALAFCFMSVGFGVATGQGRKALPQLEREANEAIKTWADTNAELTILERRLAAETKALDKANARVREAEADGGPFASAEIQRRRREARTIANRKAAQILKKAQVAPRHEFERVAMIEARSALASGLLRVADRLANQAKEETRSKQIRDYTEKALKELSKIAELRKLGKRGIDLGRPVRPLGPDADVEELDWRLRAYRRQIKTATGQLRKLKPREDRLQKRVVHLAKLFERGYALPDLTKTLERERSELTQVQGLRQEIEKQTSYYQKLAVQLQERLDARRSGDKK